MKKYFSSIIILLILWTLMVPGIAARAGKENVNTTGTNFPQDGSAKIAPAVLLQIRQNSAENVRVIVVLARQANLNAAYPKGLGGVSKTERREAVYRALVQTAINTQPTVLDEMRAKGVMPKSLSLRSYWIFNGFAMTANAEVVQTLANSPEVAHIYPDEVIQIPADELETQPDAQNTGTVIHLGGNRLPLASEEGTPAPFITASPTPAAPTPIPTQEDPVEWGVKKIAADQVWKDFQITGEGVVVGTIDSGVFWEHPALKEKYRGWDGASAQHKFSWFDAIGGKETPYDDQGHGTHTMGSIVGSTPDGIVTGIAPGAKWISVKALDSHGSGMASDLLKAMEWMLAPGGDPAYAPDVISNSWGARSCEDTFQPAVDAWTAAGIVAVFSNGNNGAMGARSVGSPACYSETIGVGATDREDRMADFSSQGPSPAGDIKPDVSAPGVRIRSSLNNGSYGDKSGTSMATPYVAGVAALMLSANPLLSLDEVKSLLRKTALDLGEPGEDNLSGWGRVDALKAVTAALQAKPTTTPSAFPTDWTPTSPTAALTISPTAEFPPVTQQPSETLFPGVTPAPTLSYTPSATAILSPVETPAETTTPEPQREGQPDFDVAQTIDDASPALTYSAAWQSLEHVNFYRGTQHISKIYGSSIELTFTGSRVALVNTRAPSYGVLYVMIDGAYVGYVNLYAPLLQWQQKWTSRPLPYGEHTLKLIHYSGEIVNLDAVLIHTGGTKQTEELTTSLPAQWLPFP